MKHPINKFLSFVLVLIMVFSLVACDDGENNTSSEDSSSAVVTTSEESTEHSSEKPSVEPSEEPSVEPSEEPSKPTIDPTKDYSEWGYYGFEQLLPEPLPFSDETKWLSYTENNFEFSIKNDTQISSVSLEELLQISEDYIKSLDKHGYNAVIIDFEVGLFIAENFKTRNSIEIHCSPGHLGVTLYLHS